MSYCRSTGCANRLTRLHNVNSCGILSNAEAVCVFRRCRCSSSPPAPRLRRAPFADLYRWACHPKPRSGEGWWSQTGSNRRPHACKARALPTELWPLGNSLISSPPSPRLRRASFAAGWLVACHPKLRSSEGWWAWEDLNFRPHAYQARALTN